MAKNELIAQQLMNALNVQKIWGGILFNVLEYGARGDWDDDAGTNDTDAVQKTINEAVKAGSKLVFFPHGVTGVYRVDELTDADKVMFVGDNASFSGYEGEIMQFGDSGVTQGDIDAINARVDNIVGQTGDSNTEIVDARLPKTGSAYSTLKSRLDTEHEALGNSVSAEQVARIAGDTAEQLARIAGDESLHNEVVAEGETRATGDSAINARIDNLILESGGDSNLEVVDARTDKKGIIYPTLKNRLDADGGSEDLAGPGRTNETVKGNADAIAALGTTVTAHHAETTKEFESRGISAINFGVVGGGVVNDTENLQAAIDYCSTNSQVLVLNGVYAVTGVTFGVNAKVIGDAKFIPINDNQPFVVAITSRIEWNGKLFVDGMNKALYGIKANSFIHSHISDVEVTKCKVWGFTFVPIGNNAMVQIDKFRGTSNGIKHTSTFTVDSVTTVGGNKDIALTLDNAISSSAYFQNSYDIIYAIYNNRPYKVKTVNGVNAITIINLPLLAGNTGSMDIIIGGALNIPSYGDNGVGNWGVLDIFGNPGVGINMSALYGHNFDRPVMQGNSIGIACQDISIGVNLNSPYFELNVVDIVVWSYIRGTMIDPVVTYSKIFSLANHNLYGYDYNHELNIIATLKSPNMSNDISTFNAGSKTIYPTKNYAYAYNVNQTAKTFTIKNDPVYQNTMSNYIHMTLDFAGGSALTFNLTNANGDTVQGGSSYVVNVVGKVHIVITKVDNDWKVTVLPGGLKSAARPTSGTFKKGDYVENTSPVESGTSPNKYIVYGWKRMTDGNAHVSNTDWFDDRRLTGN